MNAAVERIIGQVRAGRVEAYAEIVRRYQQQIWRIGAWALRDVHDTEELVQQAFVSAYLKLDSFRSGEDFGVWLRTIARNLVREEMRRRVREDRRLGAYQRELDARLASPDGADAGAEERLRAALDDCRSKLGAPAQRALEMRYDRGMSFGEIAAALGRTAAAAKQLLTRTRLALRRCIEAAGGQP